MNYQSSYIATLTVLLSIALPLTAQEIKSQASTWYDLAADQIYHSDITLKPGESQTLNVASRVPIIVGFKTNMTRAKVKQYGQNKENPSGYPPATASKPSPRVWGQRFDSHPKRRLSP